jgi:hypothetical protein
MLIRYTGRNSSVKKFLKYILLRHQNGYEQIDEDFGERIYQAYVDFCQSVNEDYFHERIFQRELGRLGILSEIRWVRTIKKLNRVRILDVKSVEAALGVWVDNSVTHADIIEIDGVKYRLITKLEKLDWSSGHNPHPKQEE